MSIQPTLFEKVSFSYGNKSVLENFDNASYKYNNGASLQKVFAKKLAKQCTKRRVNPGLWVDLGSGTGLLANELEKQGYDWLEA